MLAILFPAYVFAQSPIIRMFEQYQNGTARYTSGQLAQGKFNYDLSKGVFMFLDDKGEEMVIANPGIISSIEINGRTFERVNNDEFCERIALPENKAYYIKWLSTHISAGKASGYGGYSQTSSVSNINNYERSGSYTGIGVDEIFRSEEANKYYLMKDGKLKPFLSPKSLTKLLPAYAAEITQFIDANKTDFKSSASVQKLMEFCVPFL